MSDKFTFTGRIVSPLISKYATQHAKFQRPFQRGLLKILGDVTGLKQTVFLREYELNKLTYGLSNFEAINEACTAYDQSSVQKALDKFHELENKSLRRAYGLGYNG